MSLHQTFHIKTNSVTFPLILWWCEKIYRGTYAPQTPGKCVFTYIIAHYYCLSISPSLCVCLCTVSVNNKRNKSRRQVFIRSGLFSCINVHKQIKKERYRISKNTHNSQFLWAHSLKCTTYTKRNFFYCSLFLVHLLLLLLLI